MRTVERQHGRALRQLAAEGNWGDLFSLLVSRNRSTFVTGSPGVWKSTFLKGFHIFLKEKWPHEGEVVIVTPTGSSAKTACRQTYHSFFGLPRDYQADLDVPAAEAGRILKQDRFRFISRRLGQVRLLLLDGVSMVPAARLFVMVALLHLSQPATSPPCVLYAFGDLLQLGPLSGSLAFLSAAWRELFGMTILELALVHRQSDSSFVQVIKDARNGRCSSAVESLMNDCALSDERYEELKCNVLHLMPRYEEVQKHNAHCLQVQCGNKSPLVSIAIEDVDHDKDRDQALPGVDLSRVSEHSWVAALVDCVAPRCVPHCMRARLMLTNNRYLGLGLYHGSIGILSSYKEDGTPVVRFDHQKVPCGVSQGLHGVYDAGDDLLEVECLSTSRFSGEDFGSPRRSSGASSIALLPRVGHYCSQFTEPVAVGGGAGHRARVWRGHGQRRDQSGGGQEAHVRQVVHGEPFVC